MRKNRKRKLNGIYFVKSSMVPETAKLLSSEDTQYMFMGILEEAMIKFNKRFNQSGTVWHSRFKSILLKVKKKVEKFIKIINELPGVRIYFLVTLLNYQLNKVTKK